MTRRLLAGTLAAVPGLAWIVLGLAAFQEEYFFLTYMAGGVTITLFALLTAGLLAGLPWFLAARIRLGIAVLAGVMIGWVAGIALMALLNLTPLCVGQDNGDGNNNLGMCIGYTILYALVYTTVMFGAAIALGLIGWAAGKLGMPAAALASEAKPLNHS